MIKSFQLFKDSDINEGQKLLQDFVKGLSEPSKKIPFWTAYFGEGYDYWKKICTQNCYYGKHKEMEMFENQKSEMLKLFSMNGRFNLVDLGVGDGDKTRKLLSQAYKIDMQMQYLPIDFQHETILKVTEKVKNLADKIPMTFLTSKFQEGIKWTHNNKKGRNVYLFLAGTFGTLQEQQQKDLLNCLKNETQKGDIVAFSFMKAIDPYIIQRTFFNQNRYWIDWMLTCLKRANIELGANFNVDKFWPHTYYEPITKNAYGVIVSKENQSVQFKGHKFNFYEGQTIQVMTATRFTQDDAFKAMNRFGGFHKVGKFEDQEGYTMLLCLQKE